MIMCKASAHLTIIFISPVNYLLRIILIMSFHIRIRNIENTSELLIAHFARNPNNFYTYHKTIFPHRFSDSEIQTSFFHESQIHMIKRKLIFRKCFWTIELKKPNCYKYINVGFWIANQSVDSQIQIEECF